MESSARSGRNDNHEARQKYFLRGLCGLSGSIPNLSVNSIRSGLSEIGNYLGGGGPAGRGGGEYFLIHS